MHNKTETRVFGGLIDQRIHGLIEILSQLDSASKDVLALAAHMLTDCLRSGRSVYVCGNGGSAADAQHISGELAGRFLRERRALPCLALSVDTSVLTAIGNDYGFDQVFSRQVEAYVRPGDVLWCLSTSGNSANLLEAARKAKSIGAAVLGFTGRGGGKLAPLCDVCFCAPAEISYAIQQVHQFAYHVICELVEKEYCE
jgi:D-sedoheptulose 7-phosphate isomerase